MTSSAKLALTLATAIFGSFVWALRGHFTSARMPRGMWLVSALSALCFVTYVLALVGQLHPPGLIAVGMGLQVAAFALFVWAVRATRTGRLALAFDLAAAALLVRSGPYRYIRHPFYSSYLLFWGATILQVRAVPLSICVICIAVLYGIAAVIEEQGFAGSPLASEYRFYKATTGRFLPKLTGAWL